MMPALLSSKKELAVLGINSGTSADGLDLALIRFARGTARPRVTVVDGVTMPYPRKIKHAIEDAIRAKTVDLEELARLDIAYGHYLGETAARFIRGKRLRVDLIASHGQTIGHYPAKKKTLNINRSGTVQIGDGNAVAAASGLPVVSDFRQTDIALGGEGAPLTPFVNHLLFADKKSSRIVVNIGGIANYSYHPAGGKLDDVTGADCGPGNVLSDLGARLLFHRPYDRDGRLARKGAIVPDLVRIIEDANAGRGVSTGREQFDWPIIARLVHGARRLRVGHHDIMASIADATAKLIFRAVRSHLKDARLETVYLTGGGRRNLFMVERLQAYCRASRVLPIEALGYDGDLLEAVSFAVLGGCFIFGIGSTMPRITGGKQGGVAGKLSLPPEAKP